MDTVVSGLNSRHFPILMDCFSPETFATHRGDSEDRGCNHPLTDTATFSASSFYGTGKEGHQAKFDCKLTFLQMRKKTRVTQ